VPSAALPCRAGDRAATHSTPRRDTPPVAARRPDPSRWNSASGASAGGHRGDPAQPGVPGSDGQPGELTLRVTCGTSSVSARLARDQHSPKMVETGPPRQGARTGSVVSAISSGPGGAAVAVWPARLGMLS
jgi:hypothetical protein